MDFAALAQRAALSEPMAGGAVPILHGRTLYLDGDGLAYYCAGNDETLLSEARARLRDKIEGMLLASGAGRVIILLTGSGGHKGHRYAIARVKPYQGQRVNNRRPKNWQGLRALLEDGAFGPCRIVYDREADDCFAEFGWADPENTVHGTQDKDMRMCPGYHLDWIDNRMFYLPPNTYSAVFNDKQYGMKWFWLQMLHGDTADAIPGLPKVVINGKAKLVGEVTAGQIMAHYDDNASAARGVAHAYASYYGDRWLVEMLEQACLLWMRRSPDALWDDVITHGPLNCIVADWVQDADSAHFTDNAIKEIQQRVKEADDYNALQAEGQRDSIGTGEAAS